MNTRRIAHLLRQLADEFEAEAGGTVAEAQGRGKGVTRGPALRRVTKPGQA